MEADEHGNMGKGEPLGLSSLAGAHPGATLKNADRRRHLFRRRKDHFTSSSYDSSSQSRSSSVESQSSSVQRGLESVLKASTLFAWSSIESSCQVNNQPSFIECKSSPPHLNSFRFNRSKTFRAAIHNRVRTPFFIALDSPQVATRVERYRIRSTFIRHKCNTPCGASINLDLHVVKYESTAFNTRNHYR